MKNNKRKATASSNPEPLSEFGTDVSSRKNGRRNSGKIKELPEKEEQDNRSKLSQWAMAGDELYLACGKTYKTLPAGMYTIQNVRGEPAFEKRPINIDELILFPDSDYENIINEVVHFWEHKHLFQLYRFLHRRGFLFYGPQGSGKSCLVQLIIKDVIDRDGIVVNCSSDPDFISSALNRLRDVEPDRKVVCLFEDIDAIIDSYGEDDILSLLDGEDQIDTVLNIATTNYPEKLDKRIIARPRRFDRILKVGMPNKETRRMYFEKKFNLSKNDENLDKWVKETEDFSFAALAELVISVKCFGKQFDESVKYLRNLIIGKKYSSQEFDKLNIGFSRNN